MATPSAAEMKTAIDQIAKTDLGIETLDTRKSDVLDFHDLAVWSIRAALEAAYKAGAQADAIQRDRHSR
jgi:hypothetical protein